MDHQPQAGSRDRRDAEMLLASLVARGVRIRVQLVGGGPGIALFPRAAVDALPPGTVDVARELVPELLDLLLGGELKPWPPCLKRCPGCLRTEAAGIRVTACGRCGHHVLDGLAAPEARLTGRV